MSSKLALLVVVVAGLCAGPCRAGSNQGLWQLSGSKSSQDLTTVWTASKAIHWSVTNDQTSQGVIHVQVWNGTSWKTVQKVGPGQWVDGTANAAGLRVTNAGKKNNCTGHFITKWRR